MDGAFAAGRVAAHIEMQGESVTVARGATAAAVKGVRLPGASREGEIGSSGEDTVDVKVAAKPLVDAGWPVPPLAGDLLTLGGRAFRIVNVDPAYVGGVPVHYVLTVAGTQ